MSCLGFIRPHFGLLDDTGKVAYGKLLFCRILDDVLAGIAILVR